MSTAGSEDGMELYGSSAGSSSAELSRSSSVSGMSPEVDSDGSLSAVTSDASASDRETAAKQRFNPEDYLAAHKKALLERSRRGVPGHKMQALYR